MTPDERFNRIEAILEKQQAAADKNLEGIQALIVVSRTVLTSIQEDRTNNQTAFEQLRAEMRELNRQSDEKLNILIDTVDRFIRRMDERDKPS